MGRFIVKSGTILCMSILPVHEGKRATVSHEGATYSRHMVHTGRIDSDTSLEREIIDSTDGFLRNGDIVCIAESVVAITQQRAYKISDIRPGFTARLLSRFVSRTPAGIGLGMPETMQLAVEEVGAPRLYLAAAVSAMTRTFGWHGNFYRVAGERARGIDGPTPGTLPPYNEYATLIPNNPREVAQELETKLTRVLGVELEVVIVDANDIGVNILGADSRHQERLAESLCADNPMGQGHEQTPVMICRKVS